MKQNRIRYLLNFLFFIAISFFNTQLIPYLKCIGYNEIERGMILAANALFSIFFQILFGYLCDRYKTMKKFFYFAYALFLGFGIPFFYFTNHLFFLHIIVASMMVAMIKVLTAIIETWMLYLDKKEYGKYRAVGALGLCVGSFVTGLVIDSFSYTGIIIACVIVSCITLYYAFYCDEVKHQEKVEIKDMIHALKNKEYLFYLGVYFLIYMVGTADQYVVIDKMIEFDAGATYIGIKWMVQSIMEIPFFLFAAKILKKYDSYLLLRFGIIMYGIKFILYGLSPSPFYIVLTTTLQIVTLPVIVYTSKMIFDEICPNLKASAQMMAMAVFISGSAFVTPLITSVLASFLGYDMTLYICGVFTLIPFLLLFYKKHVMKEKM